MANKYVKDLSENTSPASTDAVEIDDGVNSEYVTLANLVAGAVTPGTSGNVLTSNGTAWTSAAAGGSSKFACNGRLTLETGVAISTTDQADKTTLYYTPYQGNQIGLYDGSSAWNTISFAELSLNISAFTASKPYDIWVYNNAGTATLDSTVWTSGTARATALALQDGVYVKTGATTRRYVGTIYMDAASKCQDKLIQRFVWNYYNKVNKLLYNYEGTAHTYNGTFRKWNNSDTNNKLEMIIGIVTNINPITYSYLNAGADGSVAAIYQYMDGSWLGGRTQFTNTNIFAMSGSTTQSPMIAEGYHLFQLYERGTHASSGFTEQQSEVLYLG